jgi:hypothetical protein
MKARLRILRNKLGTVIGATVNGALLPSVAELKLSFDARGVPLAEITIATPDIEFETLESTGNKVPADYGKQKLEEGKS